MAASTEAYEHLLEAVIKFDQRNVQIAEYLTQATATAVAAMNDATSEKLAIQISAILKKMNDVSDKTKSVKTGLQNTLNELIEMDNDLHNED